MSNSTCLASAAILLSLCGASGAVAQGFAGLAGHRANAGRTDLLTDDGEGGPKPASPRARVANAEATALGRRFINYGDARFGRQEFSQAYSRYRQAAQAAPNLAEAYFRQAVALAALGRYASAVKAIRRGLAFQPDWAAGDFRLDQLYADHRAAKEMHLERLAKAADEEPERADLMFLLGVELFFDDRRAMATTFLNRSAELGMQPDMLAEFLKIAARSAKSRLPGEDL